MKLWMDLLICIGRIYQMNYLKDLVFNQLMDGTEWTVDIYSVTGSGGSEKTYSAPNSAAYVMIQMIVMSYRQRA